MEDGEKARAGGPEIRSGEKQKGDPPAEATGCRLVKRLLQGEGLCKGTASKKGTAGAERGPAGAGQGWEGLAASSGRKSRVLCL